MEAQRQTLNTGEIHLLITCVTQGLKAAKQTKDFPAAQLSQLERMEGHLKQAIRVSITYIV